MKSETIRNILIATGIFCGGIIIDDAVERITLAVNTSEIQREALDTEKEILAVEQQRLILRAAYEERQKNKPKEVEAKIGSDCLLVPGLHYDLGLLQVEIVATKEEATIVSYMTCYSNHYIAVASEFCKAASGPREHAWQTRPGGKKWSDDTIPPRDYETVCKIPSIPAEL